MTVSILVKMEWLKARKCLLWSLFLGSATLTILCWVYLLGNNNHGLLLTRTLHAYEGSSASAPSSYFTLDWTMRPQTDANGRGVPGTNCREDGDKNCSPELWQLASICPSAIPASSGTTLTWTPPAGFHDEQIKALFSDKVNGEHGWHYLKESNGDFTITVTNAKEWRYLMEVCAQSRVPTLSVIPNSVESYGLFGTHSFIVISQFIFILFFIVAVVNNIRRGRKEAAKDGIEHWSIEYANFLHAGFVLLFILVLCFRLFGMDSVVTVTNTVGGVTTEKEFIRMIPHSSYMYGFVYLALFSFYTCIALYDEAEILQMRKVGPMTTSMVQKLTGVPTATGQPIEMIPPGTLAMPNQITNQMGSAGLYSQGMDGLNKYMLSNKKPAESSAELQNANLLANDAQYYLERHEWPVIQFFVLPLWLLAIHLSGHGVIVDVKLQAVFVASVVYCILDLYIYNYKTLRAKYKKFFNAQAPTLKQIVPWTSSFFVVSLFQLLLVIMLNFELSLGYDNMGEYNQAHIRTRIDLTGITIFNIWVGLSFLGKFLDNFYNREQPMSYRPDEVMQFIFITLVFLSLCLNIGYHYSDHNYILNPLTRNHEDNHVAIGSEVMSNILEKRMIWSSKMIEI